MRIDLPPITLEPVGQRAGAAPDAWLHADVTILGVAHHLNAVAVVMGRRGRHRPEASTLALNLRHLRAATCSPTPLRTVRIRDRDYVLVLTPVGEEPTPNDGRPR